MRLNKNHISTELINEHDSILKGFVDFQQGKIEEEHKNRSDQQREVDNRKIEESFSNLLNPTCERYILRKSAIDVVDRIKVDNVDLCLFKSMEKFKTIEFVIDEGMVYRTFFDGVNLRMMIIFKFKKIFWVI